MLRLGHCDKNKIPTDRKKFLDTFHNVPGVLQNTVSFREDDRSRWRRFTETSSQEVSDLQKFLSSSGFMPHSDHSGIFGYATLGAVRLFQEYVRVEEQVASMKPDGLVGRGSQKHIERWKKNGLSSRWNYQGSSRQNSEHNKWFDILKAHKAKSINSRSKQLEHIRMFTKKTDSMTPSNWLYQENDVHLIGIRINAGNRQLRRSNDDLFVLLINGMVFKFWGSTDPSQGMASRPDEPFLVEGQHKYRFSWHKISSEAKVYRALRPYNHGVLVYRDRNNDNSLDASDIDKGLDKNPNRTINIHWSGKGNTNFSAGCQVIAGNSYINDVNKVVDCSRFASTSYSGLSDEHKMTKGAYNVISDLVISYAAFGTDFLYYTLIDSSNEDLIATMGSGYAEGEVKRMKELS